MKILAAVTTLVLATINPAYANYDSKVPHPEGGKQTLPNGNLSSTRYSFSFHITGRTLSELSLTTPQGIRLSEDISIVDETGKIVRSTIKVEGLKTIISFSEPIKLGKNLRIDLNNVKTMYHSSIWELTVSGKLDNLKEDISLQTIRMSPAQVR